MVNQTTIQLKNGSQRVASAFQSFFKAESSGGIILLLCTAIALVWANSSWSDSYVDLWQTKVTVGGGSLQLSKALILWINDGLMAIFFLLVGLEIKREVLVGELAALRQAILPIAAALGGVVIPATIYITLNGGTTAADGWAIPIATDIAFALGVLALLGDRVPTSLKVFLTALAIVDDITAVVVIAVFYTAQIKWAALGIGFGCLVVLITLNRLGMTRLLIYMLIGVVMWVAFLKSGVHATVSGVLLAMTIPAHSSINAGEFLAKGRRVLDSFASIDKLEGNAQDTPEYQDSIHALEKAAEGVQSPLLRAEHGLHYWVAFFIMPVFALANAGVRLEGDLAATLTEPLTLGIILGLVIGKPLGITIFSWLAVRLGLADKPADMDWLYLHGAAWLAGIGFTMSLFITGLAFGSGSMTDLAKTGILTASLIAGLIGWTILRMRGSH